MRRRAGWFLVFVAMIGAGYLLFVNHKDASPLITKLTQPKTLITGFNKKALSLDDPDSIWIIVNKQRPLNPKDFEPSDLVVPNVELRTKATSPEMQLRRESAGALESMFAGAKEDGLDLMLDSGYRSYSYQVTLYNGYVKTQGQATADSQSARPGYSEHQTGLAADIGTADHKCEIQACFGDFTAGKWLAANAYLYGFVVRYQEDTEATVGYIYEPWHFRYVGKDLAEQVHKNNNQPLETFFSLPAAADY